MAQKPDISTKKLSLWDQYKDKTPDVALKAIYAHVEDASTMMCGWYWASIRVKRWTSLTVRVVAFALLLFGTTLPIFAAVQPDDRARLLFTQWAVALLALAGLIQIADRVFGWSSGWMRYITTVTTMENLKRAFELEWARYLVSKVGKLDSADTRALFDLAKALENELTKLQADETTKWVVEFNSGMSLLESLIKTQREDTDKKLETIRTSLTAQENTAKTQENSIFPGAVEVTLLHKAELEKVQISFDDESPVEFLGAVWSRLKIPPGLHQVLVQTFGDSQQTIQKVIEVPPAGVVRLEVKLTA